MSVPVGSPSIVFNTMTLGDASAAFMPTLKISAAASTMGLVTVSSGAVFQQDTTSQLSFGGMTILPGGTLTHTANAASRTATLNLNVSGNFNLQAGASIAVSGLGYAGRSGPGTGPGAGSYDAGGAGGGGGHGGNGGAGAVGAVGGTANDSATNPADLGSSGGSYPAGYLGGNGGGAVILSVGGTLTLNGTISANGTSGTANAPYYSAGGGAGGTVNLTAVAITGAGTLQANGGTALTTNTGGGGGGGGRIAIVVSATDSSNLNLQANAGGKGSAAAANGGAGVIALKTPGGANYNLSIGNLTGTPQSGSGVSGSSPTFSTVTANNCIVNFDPGSSAAINSLIVAGNARITGNNFTFGAAAPLVVRSGGSLQITANQLTFPTNSPIEVQSGGSLAFSVGTNSGGALIVRAGGTFQQLNTQSITFDSVVVEPGGVLTHAANAATRSAVLNLSVAGNFDLQAGASIAVSGLGYAGRSGPGTGPGAGNYDAGGAGGGGGHGGSGGAGAVGAAGGAGNDSATNPADLGSSGGSYPGYLGGNGGGAVILNVGGTLTLNGMISADGASGTANGPYYSAGGGAGGTVNLTAAAITGSGTVQTNGGTALTTNTGGGGGGGGRVAIVVTGTDSSNLNLRADAGGKGSAAAANGGAGVISLKTPGGSQYNLTIGGLTQIPQSGTPVAGSTPTFSTVTLGNSIVSFDAGSTVTINSLVIAGTATLSANTLVFGANSPLFVSPGAQLTLSANNLTFGANAPIEVKNGAAFRLGAQSISGGVLNVRGGGTFQQTNTAALNFLSVLVEPGGILTHAANGTTRTAVLNLNVTGNFDLQAGASIAVSGLGYAGRSGAGSGPGAGNYDSGGAGGGGGHGGSGGAGAAGAVGGTANDSAANPVDLGSSGGSYPAGYQGGNGGGAVILSVGGTLTLNGTISANGASGTANASSYSAGGGSGGTVNLTVAAITGSGTVQANGGTALTTNTGGGGGGGGRIAIVVTGTDSSNLNLRADAGGRGSAAAANGGAGVISLKTPGGSQYNLTIGGLTQIPQSGTPVAGSTPAFATVTLGNSIVSFDAGSTVTINSLVVAGTATLTGNSLIFGSGGLRVKSGGLLMMAANSSSGGGLFVEGGGVFQQTNTAALGFTSVDVAPGGVMSHAANGTARAAVLNLNVTGDFTLQAGASIAVSGLGYAGHSGVGAGPGAGNYDSGGAGGGGGHGGNGGTGAAGAAGGAANDSAANPADLGSSGGSYPGYLGGSGGGAVILNVSGTLTINGTISANGTSGTANGPYYSGGGGAGGTVNLTAAAITGSGTVQANGGTALTTNTGGGGGGGGRVALTGCKAAQANVAVSGGNRGSSAATPGQAGSFQPTTPPGCPSAPLTPANLAVTATGENSAGLTFIAASWSPVAQATSYSLQASTAADFSGTVYVATSATTTATLLGLTPNASYFLEVSGLNAIGASPFSAVVSTLTPADLTSPLAPTLASASAQHAGAISLRWQPSASGEASAFYNVYRATGAFTTVMGRAPMLAHLSATNTTDAPSTDGVYFYGVTALDPSGNESGLSNVLSTGSIHAANAPIADLTASFVPSQKQTILSWSAPSTGTAVAYSVYRATFAAPAAAAPYLLQGGIMSRAFVDQPSPAQDATYFYLVTSLNPVGDESAASNSAASIFDVHAPVITVARVTDGQYSNRNLTPSISITDFSSFVSTTTLNGQPFVSTVAIYQSLNQTVSEGGTASLSCVTGTIQSYTSKWATSCGNPQNCGTCPIDGTSCSVVYDNAHCGDVAPGCSKDGRLAINCGVPGVTLTLPGTYFLAISAQDAFANATSTTLSFTIDKASPTLILVSPSNGLVTNQNVSVVFQSSDDFTPANQLVVKDELGNVVASPYVISAEGTRNLTLTARDLAGNAASASTAFTLDKTPPATVADMRIVAVHASSGTVDLSWSASTDSLSGVARYIITAATVPITQANVGLLAAVPNSVTPQALGSTQTFTTTVSTTQVNYFAVQAVDAAGNAAAVSNVPFANFAPPQVTFTNLAPSAVVSRPLVVTIQAADVQMVTQVAFFVDGVQQSVSTAAPFSFFWNTVPLADQGHVVSVTAQDLSGNVGQGNVSVVTNYAPPSAPTITSPAGGAILAQNTVTVAGSGDLFTNATLLVNNVPLASTPTVNGQFAFSGFAMGEGDNSLAVSLSDAKGLSSPSAPVRVTVVTQAPGAVTGLSSQSQAAGAVALSWTRPSGTNLTFNVYRSSVAVSTTSASLRVASNVAALSYTDTPASDGTYFYAVTAVDPLGREGGLSANVPAVSSRVAPTAVIGTSPQPPLGPGTVAVTMTLSQPLISTPTLTFTPSGGGAVGLTLTQTSSAVYTSQLIVSTSLPSGPGLFAFQGFDPFGNSAHMITAGSVAVIDTNGSSAAIVLASTTLSSGGYPVTLTTSKPAPQTPALSFTPQGGNPIAVALTGGPSSWSGSIVISSTTGDGAAVFSYQGVDSLGNVGTGITQGQSFTILTLAPPAPLFFRAFSRPAGNVALSWTPPLNATVASYSVYRSGALILDATHLTPLIAGTTQLQVVDTPANGLYFYAATAVDAAGNMSDVSNSTSAVSSRALPLAPGNLAGVQQATGVSLTWNASATGETAVAYNLYRTTYPFASVAGLTPLQSALTGSTAASDFPSSDAFYYYGVTALSFAGNESPVATVLVQFDAAGPVIVVDGVSDRGFYNGPVTPAISVNDLYPTPSTATMNGAPFVGGTTLTQESTYTLTIAATDQTGRASTRTLSFEIDKTSPTITLSGISDGTVYHNSVTPQFGAADKNIRTTTATLNGHPYASGTPVTANGLYSLVVYASDLAGNATVQTAGFTVFAAPAPPGSLSVTINPGQATALNWSAPAGYVVSGYNVYRNGNRASFTLLPAPSFTDSAYTGGAPAVYEVSAVDTAGQEGARAKATVISASLASAGSVTLTRGYMDNVPLSVTNGEISQKIFGPLVLKMDGVTLQTGEVFLMPASNTAQVSGQVFTDPAKPSSVAIEADLGLPTDAGSSVTLVSRFNLPVQSAAQPAIQIFPTNVTKGATAVVRAQLLNQGTADLDIVTSSRNAAVTDLQLIAKDASGSAFSTTDINEQDATTFNSANPTYSLARIPPGGTFLFMPFSVSIPANADSVTLQTAISKSYFGYGTPEAIRGAGFQGSLTLGTTALPYTGTAATDKAVYNQGETPVISGRAVDPANHPVPNVPLTVVLTVSGYDRTATVQTDANGNYTFTPSIGSNEYGFYTVSAAHPAFVGRQVNATFNIIGLTASPANVNVSIPQGNSRSIPIQFSNIGQTPLNNVQVNLSSSTDLGGKTSATLAPAALSGDLAPGHAVNLILTLTAAADALGQASYLITFTNAQGTTRTIPISFNVQQALPAPSWNPLPIQVAMQPGQSSIQSATLSNFGTAAIKNARLTGPSTPWITLASNQFLGDIQPQGSVAINLQFRPPTGTSGVFVDTVTVQGDGGVSLDLPIQVTVTQVFIGAAAISVTDAVNNGPLANAQVNLVNLDTPGVSYTATTDANGVAVFPSIHTSAYSVAASASGYTGLTLGAKLYPSKTNQVPVFLQRSAVSLTWNVTPTTITDKFDVTLAMVFKSDPLIPVIQPNPPAVSVNIPAGGSVQTQYQITNTGGVDALSTTLTPDFDPASGVTVQVKPSVIPLIHPGETKTVTLVFSASNACSTTSGAINHVAYFGPTGSLNTGSQLLVTANILGANATSCNPAIYPSPPAFTPVAGGYLVSYPHVSMQTFTGFKRVTWQSQAPQVFECGSVSITQAPASGYDGRATQLVAAGSPAGGTYKWTSTAGTFDNPSSATPFFTPTTADSKAIVTVEYDVAVQGRQTATLDVASIRIGHPTIVGITLTADTTSLAVGDIANITAAIQLDDPQTPTDGIDIIISDVPSGMVNYIGGVPVTGVADQRFTIGAGGSIQFQLQATLPGVVKLTGTPKPSTSLGISAAATALTVLELVSRRKEYEIDTAALIDIANNRPRGPAIISYLGIVRDINHPNLFISQQAYTEFITNAPSDQIRTQSLAVLTFFDIRLEARTPDPVKVAQFVSVGSPFISPGDAEIFASAADHQRRLVTSDKIASDSYDLHMSGLPPLGIVLFVNDNFLPQFRGTLK